MARDLSIPVRRAGLIYLESKAELADRQPAVTLYPPQPETLPVWPYVQWGVSTSIGNQAAGYDGSVLSVRVHCYVKGPGDEACGELTALVAALLDDASFDLPIANCYATVKVSGTQIFQDPNADKNSWHGVVSCRIFVAAPSL